jgi:DNA-binding NarL/FixJ family response regulator
MGTVPHSFRVRQNKRLSSQKPAGEETGGGGLTPPVAIRPSDCEFTAQGKNLFIKPISKPHSDRCFMKVESAAGVHDGNWKDCLILRSYCFLASRESDRDLATRIEHGGVGFFPSRQSNMETDAARTPQIYQMFVATLGGAGGYLVKCTEPDRLLEPILNVASWSEFMTDGLLLRLKYHFQELLQLRSTHNNPALAKLTRREREVLALLSKGCLDKEIAQATGISVWTMLGHIKYFLSSLMCAPAQKQSSGIRRNNSMARNSMGRKPDADNFASPQYRGWTGSEHMYRVKPSVKKQAPKTLTAVDMSL